MSLFFLDLFFLDGSYRFILEVDEVKKYANLFGFRWLNLGYFSRILFCFSSVFKQSLGSLEFMGKSREKLYFSKRYFVFRKKSLHTEAKFFELRKSLRRVAYYIVDKEG